MSWNNYFLSSSKKKDRGKKLNLFSNLLEKINEETDEKYIEKNLIITNKLEWKRNFFPKIDWEGYFGGKLTCKLSE